MDQFANRIANYSGVVNEISVKQRNIFDLQDSTPFNTTSRSRNIRPEGFPYYYEKTLPPISSNRAATEFKRIMDAHGKTKNIFQGVKQDLGFLNRDFSIGTQKFQAKLYDFITMITSMSITTIKQQSDETFLVPESELGFGTRSQRFAEKVSGIRFLSEVRKFIDSNARDLDQIYESQGSQTFFLGYKIEKYLDNDATEPIQTYYTNDKTFIDTQLKYGRRYIYKTKVLLCILGSSYSYSNLFISNEESQMTNEFGETPPFFPADFADVSSDEYKAYVDVDIIPSFKILEYQVDEDETSFVDSPTLPPQVDIFNRKDLPNIQMRFSPNFFKVEGVSAEDNKELMRSLEPLTDDDVRITNLLSISKNTTVQPDYFTGIYEVYRTTTPPEKISDFADNFLTTIALHLT